MLAALPVLSMEIVEFVREHGRITPAEAIRPSGASRNTVKPNFRDLVERWHLEQHGSRSGQAVDQLFHAHPLGARGLGAVKRLVGAGHELIGAQKLVAHQGDADAGLDLDGAAR